mmetsp:Transcript_15065/g.21961  ORF Transcript_15065/g.21961 Transcript_15065/m.21961 type:complete len:103 (+) Transcript_15065:141-449(+)
MKIYFCFYFSITCDIVTVLLTFVNIHHFKSTLSHAHTEAHTHKYTCMISTQDQCLQSDTGVWLGGAEERFFVRDNGLAHTQVSAHCIRSVQWSKKACQQTDI